MCSPLWNTCRIELTLTSSSASPAATASSLHTRCSTKRVRQIRTGLHQHLRELKAADCGKFMHPIFCQWLMCGKLRFAHADKNYRTTREGLAAGLWFLQPHSRRCPRPHLRGQPLQSGAPNAKHAPKSAICGVLRKRSTTTGSVPWWGPVSFPGNAPRRADQSTVGRLAWCFVV